MEAFQLLSTGAWSLLPPLLALGLALITKEVYSSLLVGVFAGLIIYEFTLDGASVAALVKAFCDLPTLLSAQISSNGALLLFLALLGSLTVIITVAGGSRAYAEWAAKRVKSARMAQLMTAILGIVIFVDDYFNCLTVGAVMRPVTDRMKVSHEKLAYLIDSSAAPVCIIAPVSSWAVAVGGYMGDGGFNTFVSSIPYNLYALLTIFMVFAIVVSKVDFGPMREAELEWRGEAAHTRVPAHGTTLNAVSSQGLKYEHSEDLNPPLKMETVVAEGADLESAQDTMDQFKGLHISDKGRVSDLVVPIVVLIVFSIIGMLYSGGYFDGGVDFATAVGEDPITGLCIGSIVALLVAACMFMPRKLISLDRYVESGTEGVRTMVSSMMILVLAWSLGGVCRYMLGTGEFVSGALTSAGVSLEFLPPVVFVVAALIAFAMGTSWGTIALLMPIVLGVFPADDPMFLAGIGSALAGAVYGDHTSPISDTTILSSAGAECNHLRHVATQLPYATTVAVVCLVGYIIMGFTKSPWISLGLGVVLLLATIYVLYRRDLKRNPGKPATEAA
ncbi:MAG: Na+/H+ antiporter NhaC family protein [Eggerthellaceae bacterium]|jgi:tetracycline resistance efflux pump